MLRSQVPRIAGLTALALLAFAANSVLARVALLPRSIDAASFSTIRLVSGAAALLLLHSSRRRSEEPSPERRPHASGHAGGSWLGAAMLCLYAVPFSFAYLQLSTGTGALILFGFVQLTMIGGAVVSGEAPSRGQWLGLVLASGGLTYLMLPGLSAPHLPSAALMATAGFGWGVYSLLGRGATRPLAETTGNFVRSIPLVIALTLFTLSSLHVEWEGALLAVASGALASGVGYAIWYAALRGLTATTAAIVQLSVPVLAAAGGIVLLAEAVSLRLFLSAILVLGGIAVAISSSASQEEETWKSVREQTEV